MIAILGIIINLDLDNF